MDLPTIARQKLIERDACFICISDGCTHVSFERGIAPVIHLMDVRKNALKNAFVADKVVGKAAALLMVYAGVKDVFAFTVSHHAVCVFERAGITCAFDQLVPHIVNRSGDGMCPMEKHVLSIDDPSRAYFELRILTKRMAAR